MTHGFRLTSRPLAGYRQQVRAQAEQARFALDKPRHSQEVALLVWDARPVADEATRALDSDDAVKGQPALGYFPG